MTMEKNTTNSLPDGIYVTSDGEVRGPCLICLGGNVFWGLEKEFDANGGRDTNYTYKHGFVCNVCQPEEIEFAKRQGVLWA